MEHRWWHGKTAYQIYPKSFYDSNGDGIGDLQGIISKLDYLKELGIDIIWISPFYQSPMADQGYDISDYYNIDPIFGTMEDMDQLLAEVKKRDMYVVMDLVVNHCSDEHEWFRKACAEPDGKYGKYFYICDRPADGSLPCNWRSYFGGPVWEPLPGHEDKLYLHLFHKKQPDLNWENPELRQDIYGMINWWLEKGVAGFRIDAIINIKKKLPFRDYPVDRDDGLSSIDYMLEDAEGIMVFLDEMARETFHKHDAFTVAELFNEKKEELPGYIGDHGCFSSCFDFAETVINRSCAGWYSQAPVTAEQYKAACFASQEKTKGIGFLSNIIENHDEPRGVSRYLTQCTDAGKKMLGGLNYLLCGLPFLFQGQEIGMENISYDSPDQIDDVLAKDEYLVALRAGLTKEEALDVVSRFSRDNGRTPMQWDNSSNAGFTTGTPWIMVNPNYCRLNVATQKDDPHSVWSFYHKLIELRKDARYSDALVYGETKPYLQDQMNLMAYYRGKQILVLGNYQQVPQTVQLPSSDYNVILNNLDVLQVEGQTLLIEGWQLIVLALNA